MAENLLLAEDLELRVLLGAHGHVDHGGLEVGWEDSGQAIDGHLDVLLQSHHQEAISLCLLFSNGNTL